MFFSKCWFCKKRRHSFLLPTSPSPPSPCSLYEYIGAKSCKSTESVLHPGLRHRGYSFNFGKPYVCSFNSSPPYKSLKNAKCFTPISVAHLCFFWRTSRCATSLFLGFNKQVCHRWVCHPFFFVAQPAGVPTWDVPPAFFFVASSKCATEGGVPADEGNCVLRTK